MISYDGEVINQAPPSMPVEILGMNDSVYAGAGFLVTNDENEAKKMAEFKKMNSEKTKVLVKERFKVFLFLGSPSNTV